MFDYEVLRLIWWGLLGVLLIGFAIMDGFDLGVGMLFPFLGRNDNERRAFLETIEPVWDGNQVWFILGGGAVFAAWPPLYAVSFSGFYVAMFLVLAALILRPVGFVFRNKLPDARWRRTWDWALFVAGAVPTLVFGVAFGNLFLGVPFHFDESMRSFYTGGFFGLLTPFALLCGAVSLSMICLHGASYAALKTGEPMAGRAAGAARIAAPVFIGLFALAGFWLWAGVDGYVITGGADPAGASNPLLKSVVRAPGAWLENYGRAPVTVLFPLLAIAAAAVSALSVGRRAGVAFVASALTIAMTILTAGASLFPFLLPSSTVPTSSLTVWDASSSRTTLGIMLVAAVIFVPIVLAYTTWVFRVMRGAVTLEHVAHGGDNY